MVDPSAIAAFAPNLEIPQAPSAPEPETSNVDESKMTLLEKYQRTQDRHKKEIAKHVSREERYLESLNKLNDQNRYMMQEIAQLKEMRSHAAQEKPKGGLDDFDLPALKRQRMEWMLSDNVEDRKKAFALEEEITRRERSEWRSELQNVLTGESKKTQLQQKAQSYLSNAINLLDEEMRSRIIDPQTRSLKNNSRELQVANQIYANMKNELGEVAENVPHLQALAVLLAEKALRSQSTQSGGDARQREGELIQKRIQGQIGANGDGAPDAINEFDSAIKANDINRAILLSTPAAQRWEKENKERILRQAGVSEISGS